MGSSTPSLCLDPLQSNHIPRTSKDYELTLEREHKGAATPVTILILDLADKTPAHGNLWEYTRPPYLDLHLSRLDASYGELSSRPAGLCYISTFNSPSHTSAVQDNLHSTVHFWSSVILGNDYVAVLRDRRTHVSTPRCIALAELARPKHVSEQ